MLSIIIPYYKFIFFESTLNSLAIQTNKRFKVYIGDDSSPENPKILLKKYRGDFEFVYHRFDNNLGGISLTQHWERCIALSGNEEWVMILCDDDVLTADVVDEFYKQLPKLKGKSNVIRFATQKINDRNENISDLYFHPAHETSTEFLLRKYNSITRSSLSEYVFNMQLIRKIKFKNFPLAWYSDVIAVVELSRDNLIYSINSANIRIRYSEKSISGNKSKYFLTQKLFAQRLFCHYLLDNISSFSDRAEIRKIVLRYLLKDKKNIKLVLKYLFK